MILDLCHSWHQDPDWFWSKPMEDQVQLLGWWRARWPAAKKRKLSKKVKTSDAGRDFWLS